MVQRVVRIAPLQTAKVFAVMYGFFAVLFFVPVFVVPSLLGVEGAPPTWVLLLALPLYVGGSFLMFGLIAWLYNVAAAWVGGIEVTLEDKR